MEHDDMALIRKAIRDIACDYTLSPKVALTLLRKILAILKACQSPRDQE